MNESHVDESVSCRLNRMERSVRVVAVGAVALACVVVALVWMLAARQRSAVQGNVVARGFSLVDESGRVLARLARTSDGAVLVLESKDGSQKVLLGKLPDAAGLGMVVRDQLRVGLTVGVEGAPSLMFRDSEGRARLMSALDGGNLPLLAMWNENAQAEFVASPGRVPVLQVFDGKGAPLLSVPLKSATRTGSLKGQTTRKPTKE